MNSNSDYLTNVYPNYIVTRTSELLDIDIKSIDNWLEEAIQEIFCTDKIKEVNSGAYVMLYELGEIYDIHTPISTTEAVDN